METTRQPDTAQLEFLSPKEQKSHWLSGMAQNPRAILKNYDKIPDHVKNDASFWLSGMAQNPRAVLENYDKIPDHVKDELLSDDNIFNVFLESSKGSVDTISTFFDSPSVARDPVKQLYTIRMLALHEAHYHPLMKLLKSKGLDVSLFEEYDPWSNSHISKMRHLLKSIGHNSNSLDTNKPSHNLELESQNVDNVLEINTNITNNYDEIVSFISAIDDFHENIAEKIKKETGGHLIGLYDSVHLNTGIPKTINKNTVNQLDQDLRERKGLYRLLELTGFVYNPYPRTRYLFKTHYNGLICVDGKDKTKGGYDHKIQNRLWCVNFAAVKNRAEKAIKNAPFFKIMFMSMDKILKLYENDPNNAESQINILVDKIIQTIKRHQAPYGTGRSYSDFIDPNPKIKILNHDMILAIDTQNPYLAGRNKILSDIMHILGPLSLEA